MSDETWNAKQPTGACSLDCSECSIRLRTEEELEYWRKQGADPEKIRCDGCRSDRNGHHWSPDCKILNCCVHERKLDFCSECTDFPCQILDEWAGEFPHHAEAVERLRGMKISAESWRERD
jgi:hypothetical protein